MGCYDLRHFYHLPALYIKKLICLNFGLVVGTANGVLTVPNLANTLGGKESALEGRGTTLWHTGMNDTCVKSGNSA